MDLNDNGVGREGQGEPSVWDWFVSVLRRDPIPIPEDDPSSLPSFDLDQEELSHPLPDLPEAETAPAGISAKSETFWDVKVLRLPVAVILALFAQLALDQKPESVLLPVLFYLWSFFLVGWGVYAGDLGFYKSTQERLLITDSQVRVSYLLSGAGLSVITFFLTVDNTYELISLVTWAAALILFLLAFWEGRPPLHHLKDALDLLQKDWKVRIGRFELLFVGTLLLVIFYRIFQLEIVPTDMWSDQAEKWLDVLDILDGKYSIFFPRNMGREGLQMYVAAATATIANTGISFMTLKIGTVLMGLITLPYIYLFAKEYGGRVVGLCAMFLAGVAHWPNIISRVGLGFPLYPLFVAPALYYLVRGLRRQHRNDFLFVGLAVGLGLHGYGPARVIPIAVLAGVLVYLLHVSGKAHRLRIVSWIAMASVIAFVIFLPLFSAILEMPDLFLSRMLSRIGTSEAEYPGPPLAILIANYWDGFRMFAWDIGDQWVMSVPDKPALDWVTGAFFHLGILITVARYLRTKDWQDLFLLLSLPILILPSTLSLAFPGENPSASRASGAIVPVFTIAAIAMVRLAVWVWDTTRRSNVKYGALGVASFLLVFVLAENYRHVFHEYATMHRSRAWNTREVGEYIKGFATTIGEYETAHVVTIPHWLDGRLVAMIAGADPRSDYSIWAEDLVDLQEEERSQLFILRPDDEESIDIIQDVFPNGVFSRYESEVGDHDFMIYFVPGTEVSEYPTGELSSHVYE